MEEETKERRSYFDKIFGENQKDNIVEFKCYFCWGFMISNVWRLLRKIQIRKRMDLTGF